MTREYFLVPKSYINRHIILKCLAKKRKDQQRAEEPQHEGGLSIEEVASLTSIDKELVDNEYDVLYGLGLIYPITEQGLKGTEQPFMIAPEAIKMAHDNTALRRGREEYLPIFKVYSATVFSIIAAIVAFFTVLFNYNSIQDNKEALNEFHKISKQIIVLEEKIVSQSEAILSQSQLINSLEKKSEITSLLAKDKASTSTVKPKNK